MPFSRPVAALRPGVLHAGVALVALLLAAGAALLPSRPANAATALPAGSVTVSFVGAGIWGSDLRSTYALTNRPVSAQFYIDKRWSPRAYETAPVTAVVERRVPGGRWRATTQRVISRTGTFRVHLPVYSTRSGARDATVQYRLEVRRGGAIATPRASSSITVRYRNPSRFAGVTKYLYRTVHRYCPSAVVRIVHLSGDAAGDYTTGQYALRVDPTITDYRAVDRRSVVLHECGHYLQWRNYGATDTGWRRMTRDAKAIFGSNSSEPVEHMADCIAQAANPGGYLGYGGSCTTKQLAASKRVLAGHHAR